MSSSDSIKQNSPKKPLLRAFWILSNIWGTYYPTRSHYLPFSV